MSKKLFLYVLCFGTFFGYQELHSIDVSKLLMWLFSAQPSFPTYNIINNSKHPIGIEYRPDIQHGNQVICNTVEHICGKEQGVYKCKSFKWQMQLLVQEEERLYFPGEKHAAQAQELGYVWVTFIPKDQTLQITTNGCVIGDVTMQYLLLDSDIKDYPANCGKCYDDRYSSISINLNKNDLKDIIINKGLKSRLIHNNKKPKNSDL